MNMLRTYYTNTIGKYFSAICLSILVFPQVLFASDLQLWFFTHTNFVREETHELNLGTHVRFTDFDLLTLYMIHPRFSFRIDDTLWLGTNYSFFGVRQIVPALLNENIISNQHRLEFELLPRLMLGGPWQYFGRNRIEYLMDNRLNYISHRFRHRSSIFYDGYIDKIGLLIAQAEIFYDFGFTSWNQVRVAPLGTRIRFRKTWISVMPTFVTLKLGERRDNTLAMVFEAFFDL
jgi:hypothetical protein